MSTMSESQLYFWAIGDLHYWTLPAWHELHTSRLSGMYEDLHALWQDEEKPLFCVSPGDLVETCAQENQELAKKSIEAQLGDIPFYPGIGNHEYYGLNGEDPAGMGSTFMTVWGKPLRYSWQAGGITCIMLDYPNPFTLANPERVYISAETLAFLDETLTENAERLAIIFLHCPLSNTVLDRDPARHYDYNSLQHFFSPENSQEVRSILARHRNACLLFSGHTHSGWEAPQLVHTEMAGEHPVTHVNLMSPWYTGAEQSGPRLSSDGKDVSYLPDTPDVIPSFAVRIAHGQAIIRVRDHKTQRWLKEWIVPLQ
jgi:3',5'-cyclic AMP phosphodiesterase CpdA